MDAAAGGGEAGGVRDVYAACWLKVRCHLVHRGRFYPCTRPPHLEAVFPSDGARPALDESDGVALDGPDLARRILDKLESPEPLASCSRCLGASGRGEAHRQGPRDSSLS
jgi:cyclic pyranopterin phosphate synthase